MEAAPSFGSRLRALRRAHDLSRAALAEQVGCAVITLKKLEADERRPSRELAERLARFLALPADQLAGFVQSARAQAPPLTASLAAPIAPPDLASLPGTIIHGYRLGAQIGQGGFGAVFRAEQLALGRAVAVKVIVPQFADHPEFVRRFTVEAQTIARLEHPQIVPLYDFWREPGGAYLVMRLLRGGSLHQRLQAGPLDPAAAARLLEQLGAALGAAHRRQIVHRDLKPANILLDEDGNFYLADFGIAKDLGNTDFSQLGAIDGSPAYLSPEQLRAEPITPQADLYSLGLVLYEALAGARPFTSSTPAELVAQQLAASLPPLSARRPGLPVQLDAVLARACAKHPAERYDTAAELLAEALPLLGAPAERAHNGLQSQAHAASTTRALALADADSPYKGLRAFQEADAADFFGRAGLVVRLLERMAAVEVGRRGLEVGAHAEHRNTSPQPPPPTSRFLAVVGPSGSGKSSVVRAGLLPALRRGGLPGSERWFIATMLPGSQPLEELELALLRIAPSPALGLREQLGRDERGLLRAAGLIAQHDDEAELLLVVDQFEELWTLTADAGLRAQFIDLLAAAVADPRSRVRVLVTLRADFYDRPLLHPALGQLLRARTELVLPLAPAELAQAIGGPARRVGLALEEGLEAAIVGDVAAQPGALPLLQYALTELFARRSGRAITRAAYVAIGGVTGALTRRADALYDALDSAEQAATRQLFLRLVALGEGAEDTRRRARLAELAACATDERPRAKDEAESLNSSLLLGPLSSLTIVLDAYAQARLLTFDRDPHTRAPTVEVAHEALLREWPQLRAWLAASRDDLRTQRRLAAEADEWQSAGRDPGYLAAGAHLAQYETLSKGANVALNLAEAAFVQASLAERERQAGVERATQAALRENLARSEAQRLAAEANRLLQAGGNVELIALLAMRSMQIRYTPQGDEALAGAARLDYPVQWLRGHTSRIYAVDYAPDGRTILTGSQDATARLWDAATGACLRVLCGHTNIIRSVAFAPDGCRAATCGSDLTIRIWDLATGACIATCIGHAGGVRSLAWSSNCAVLSAGGTDRTLRLWEAQTGALQSVVEGTSSVTSIAVSPDRRQIAVGDFAGGIAIRDLATGERVQTLTGHADEIYAVEFASDGGKLLSASADKTARLWDLATGACLQKFAGHTDLLRTAAYAPDQQTVLTGSSDSSARLWDAKTGAELRRFVGHNNMVFGASYSPDGRYALIGSADGTARIWNVQPETALPTFAGHADQVVAVAYASDGQALLTGSEDRTLRLWDARSGTTVQICSGHTAPIAVGGVALSPDRARAASAGVDSTLKIWNLHTRKLERSIELPSFGWGVAFSPDGALIVVGNNDRSAYLWEVGSGRLAQRFAGHTEQVVGVAFACDGRAVLTGSDDGTARLWDVATGQELQRFVDPNGPILGVAFAPGDRRILTGSADGLVRLWDATSGQELRRFAGHTGHVWSVAASPDGHTALSASIDRTARLWDIASGQELRRFAGHTGTVFGAAFSPDGARVLTGSGDGSARLWHADEQETIGYLRGRLLRNFSADERAQYGIGEQEA